MNPAPAFQDEAHAQFFLPRDEDNRLVVQLNAEATGKIWGLYLTKGRAQMRPSRIKHPQVLVGFDGTWIGTSPSWHDALKEAAYNRLAIYNMNRRRASRPVWNALEAGTRALGSAALEPVEIRGFKGIIEGWESRPQARLFAND